MAQGGLKACGIASLAHIPRLAGSDFMPNPLTDAGRFGFLSKAALEYCLQSGRQPNIFHCHDWQTAPVLNARGSACTPELLQL